MPVVGRKTPSLVEGRSIMETDVQFTETDVQFTIVHDFPHMFKHRKEERL